MSFAAAKAKIRDILEGILLRNLIENPSFETGILGLAFDVGLAGVVNTVHKVIGAQSVKVTSSAGSATKTVFVVNVDGVTNHVVAVGNVYTISAWVRPDAGNSGTLTIRIGMEWLDSSDFLISREYGDGITANATFSIAATDDWLRISYTAVAVTGAVTARPFIEDSASTWSSGRILYIDGLMFNEGGLEDYVDGTMPGCTWEGTAHASTSKRAVKRVFDNPPNSLAGDVPCFIIYPAGVKPERRGQGWRVDRYTVLIRLVAHDSDWDRATAVMEAYREKVISAFDGSVRLDEHVTVIDGPEADAGIQFPYGDRMYLGMDFRLGMRIDPNGVTYSV